MVSTVDALAAVPHRVLLVLAATIFAIEYEHEELLVARVTLVPSASKPMLSNLTLINPMSKDRLRLDQFRHLHRVAVVPQVVVQPRIAALLGQQNHSFRRVEKLSFAKAGVELIT